MPLTHLTVRNFQSLKSIDLDLGDFTVIVGASSSGKSALIRACRALASNVRGAGVITRGEKTMAVTARADYYTITLERTETSGSYQLTDPTGLSSQTFTKLNGGVPDQITKALRIEPVPANGTSINFAGQFDRPYLLDDSGANVARVLGELTNVNTIFEAVRTANKIRLNAASTLKTRNNDLTELQGRLKTFQGLAERLKTLEAAEQLAEQAAAHQRKIEKLETALRTLDIAERAFEKASNLPSVPSPDPMNLVLNRLLDLTSKLNSVAAKSERARRAAEDLHTREQTCAQLEAELSTTLKAAGACPTCGRLT